MSAAGGAPDEGAVRHFANPRAARGRGYGGAAASILDADGFRRARAEIASWPAYAPTPLYDLPGLARRCGVARVWYKDEAPRFALGSFKGLGGAYAVFRLLAREIAARTGAPEAEITSADLMAGRHRRVTETCTVACATAGNHGKGVAWGARLFGCRAVVYIAEYVSDERARALAALGARVVRVPGHYAQSVGRAEEEAAARGWFLVSDAATETFGPVQVDILQGYRVLAEEAVSRIPENAPPTHVFVQGGVGGLAAGVCAHFWWRYGASRPRCVVVEPAAADCLQRSARAGRPATVPGDLSTLMSCLAAAEVNAAAWRVLDAAADDFLAIADAAAMDAMRLLASGAGGDPPIVVGESGVAGVAGLAVAAADPSLRRALGLGGESRVFLVGSEGANDPAAYARIVGRAPGDVPG